jgi:uncharacterized protein
MKVVIDTNVIISSIGRHSTNRKLFDAILNQEIDVCISNEILFEYREVLIRKTNEEIAENFTTLLTSLSNVIFSNIYFNWDLIRNDTDDNKFIDCYIACNADFLITEDKHFNSIKNIDFPKINIIHTEKFLKELRIKDE